MCSSSESNKDDAEPIRWLNVCMYGTKSSIEWDEFFEWDTSGLEINERSQWRITLIDIEQIKKSRKLSNTLERFKLIMRDGRA